MITKAVYTRNKGIKDQVWVYLNYDPLTNIFCVNAGYSYYDSEGTGWYSEEKEYDLNECLQEFPWWKTVIADLKDEIKSELYYL